MNTRKVDKREQHVKKKLTAAILMLLISCIMTVTSTYAWFTLSTAPEVKGIQTTIGGNGNLEIALANGETWVDTSKITDMLNGSDATVKEKNITWGNLVDVSSGYGTELLTLAPAALNITGTGNARVPFGMNYVGATIAGNWLMSPKYGVDGRVSNLTYAMDATFNDTSFTQTTAATDAAEEDRIAALRDNNGLRALGISTKMTERQSAFMTAKGLTTSKAGAARSGTSAAIEAGGSTLGQIAVKIATSSNSSTETFTQEDYDAVAGMISSTRTAALNINDAIINFIDATLASAKGQEKNIDDITYKLMSSALKGYNTLNNDQVVLNVVTPDDATTNNVNETRYSVTFTYTNTEAATTPSFTIDGDPGHLLGTLIAEYRDIMATLDAARDALPDVNPEGKYTWGGETGFSNVVGYLMDLDGDIRVGQYTVDELRDIKNSGDLSPVLNMLSNLTINLGPGSSVFYDIAALVGRVQASMNMTVTYGATMNVFATIRTTNSNAILTESVNALPTPSSEGSDEANTISDIYAYALDLIFRTNATNSSLLLQTTPVDRVYEDNDSGLETMGGGSTMTFTRTVSSFTNEQMLSLMDSIRIVFIDNENKILNIAGLDTYDEKTYVTGPNATHAEVNGEYIKLKAEYVSDGNDGFTTAGENVTPTHGLYEGNYYEVKFVEKTTSNYTIDPNTGSITASIKIIHSIDPDTKEITFVNEDMEIDVVVMENGQPVYRPIDNTKNEVGTHITDGSNGYRPIQTGETGTHVVSTEKQVVYPEICELEVNQPKPVSVLVYLDGDTVSNSDVANAESSMTGTMNLQFSSSAELIPMEYSGLHVPTPSASPDANN